MQSIYEQVSLTTKAETKQLVREVVDIEYEVVCCTMGPNSGLALINHNNQPTVTKDGVNTARSVDFGEHRKNMIAELITSAAIRVDDIVGDGTTTTVFMVKHLFDQFGDIITFGTTRIVEELVLTTKKYLAEEVMEVTPNSDNFRRMIFTTTNHQPDIANNVINLFKQYRSPNVTLIAGDGHPKDEITMQSDIVFEGDYPSQHLRPATVKNLLEFQNCRVVILDMTLDEAPMKFISTIQEYVIEHRSAVVILARGFSSEILATITSVNRTIAQTLNLVPNTLCIIPFGLNAPGTSGGAMFSDISSIIDVPAYTILPEEEALKSTLDIVVPEFRTDREGVKFDSKSPAVETKVKEILDVLVPMFESMTITEKATVLGKLAQRRIGRLRAENVTIIVSGMTEGEISERYFLYEDAVRAAETSLRFGVIPGIGYGYNQAAEKLVKNVLYPLKQKEELGPRDECALSLTESFVEILVSQYRHLTGEEYVIINKEDNYIYYPSVRIFGVYDPVTAGEQKNVYIDLVTGDAEDKPINVFDNGCAAMCAIESAWSVVKHLGRLEAILGKSNSSYVKKK